MNKLKSTLSELVNMLTSAEPNLKKDKGHVMVVSKSGTQRWNGGLRTCIDELLSSVMLER